MTIVAAIDGFSLAANRYHSAVGIATPFAWVATRERFSAIRLAARGNDVEVLDLRVIYGNGNPDDIEVRRVIRSGDRTRPLDLKGRDRAIRQIDLVYRQRPDLRRGATVCAEGLVG